MKKYPDLPGFKAGGASKMAAESIASRSQTLQERVYEKFRAAPKGMTSDECAALLSESVLSVRPRVTELYKKGLLQKTDALRRSRVTGSSQHVYTARRIPHA